MNSKQGFFTTGIIPTLNIKNLKTCSFFCVHPLKIRHFCAQKFFLRPNICMITFQNKNNFVRKNINLEENSVSTLLIPEFLLKDFLLKSKKFKGNTALYLHSLLRRFRSITHSGLIPEPEKLKTTFQERNLNLQKINFKPKNEDWVELGELAFAFGKSRCWIFVFLLKLDLANMWKCLVEVGLNKIVPKISHLELKVFQQLNRFSFDFERGYHVRV